MSALRRRRKAQVEAGLFSPELSPSATCIELSGASPGPPASKQMNLDTTRERMHP